MTAPMRRGSAGLGVLLVVVASAMATSGLASAHGVKPLPPLPAVVFSSRGLASVTLVGRYGFELGTCDSGECLGEFVTHDVTTGKHVAGSQNALPFIRVLGTQSLKDRWITLEHERVHLALWARGVVLPDDLAEKVCEAIAKERVAEMEYRDSALVIPNPR